jgi:hypothetical protein
MSTNPSGRRDARPRPLLRTILSLAVAAVIAASIPFAAIYVSTLQLQRPPVVAALSAGAGGGGRQVTLVTTASGRQVAVPSSGTSAGSALGAGGGTPVVTRTSAGARSSD